MSKQSIDENERIIFNEIYDKNLNFLIGSGASYGLLPTLELKIRNDAGGNHTIETLSKHFTSVGDANLNTLLFMHYYTACIKPAMELRIEGLEDASAKVIQNYEKFLSTILTILSRKPSEHRKCNVFTTNYDGCFELTADKILTQGDRDFIINDGARGFLKRSLHIKNFNSTVVQKSVFEQHQSEIPQINLLHMHGSVYWRKDADHIVIDYTQPNHSVIDASNFPSNLQKFSELINNDKATISQLNEFEQLDDSINHNFWNRYNQLPIVNPTKWKFYETVFEEYYYQMLRQLNYELEKPNTILITFGFSFADEHILRLVQRSLGNPTLQLYVCCFNGAEKSYMEDKFQKYNNVQFLTAPNNAELLGFNVFNESVFSLNRISDA